MQVLHLLPSLEPISHPFIPSMQVILPNTEEKYENIENKRETYHHSPLSNVDLPTPHKYPPAFFFFSCVTHPSHVTVGDVADAVTMPISLP